MPSSFAQILIASLPSTAIQRVLKFRQRHSASENNFRGYSFSKRGFGIAYELHLTNEADANGGINLNSRHIDHSASLT